MSRTKKIIAAVLVGVAALTLTACNDDAKVASDNLSKAADNFEVQRRIVFFNGITDTYLLEIVGLCSIVDEGNQLEVTCKVGDGEYKKHFLGLSDNVSYFVEQVEAERVSDTYYRVTFKPQSILPDIDIRGTQTLPESQG
jgi:predicted small secreted protein